MQFLAKFFIYCCFSATDRPFFTSDLRNKCFMSGGQNTFYQIHPDSCTEHPKQSLKCAGHNTGSATSGALLYCFHTKALSFRADPAFKQRPQPHMALIPVLTLRPHQNRAHRASGGYDLGRQRQPRHIKKKREARFTPAFGATITASVSATTETIASGSSVSAIRASFPSSPKT